jgi:hypothetical protein
MPDTPLHLEIEVRTSASSRSPRLQSNCRHAGCVPQETEVSSKILKDYFPTTSGQYVLKNDRVWATKLITTLVAFLSIKLIGLISEKWR